MNSREISRMPIQPPVLPFQKYCGEADPRTPPQFFREFTMSTLCTGVDGTDNRNFLAVLGDKLSVYAPAFPYSKTLDDMKRYFFRLTWTDAEKAKELKAIKAEKFDPNGPESWEKHLIRTYIRLQDCGANDSDFVKIMNHKIFEVEKTSLPIGDFTVVTQKQEAYLIRSDQPEYDSKTGISMYRRETNYRTVTEKRVASKDLNWFAGIVYQQSELESQSQPKLQEKGSSGVDRQSDFELEHQQKEVPVEVVRPAIPEPNNLPEQKHEVNFGDYGLQGSFNEPLLLSVFYFILYFLILHFWNFGNNFDTSITSARKN